MILSGIDHRGESQHWEGRADAVLQFADRVYVVEIKYASEIDGLSAALTAGMRQIYAKNYHKPHLGQQKTVHLLAIAFTRSQVSFTEEIIRE